MEHPVECMIITDPLSRPWEIVRFHLQTDHLSDPAPGTNGIYDMLVPVDCEALVTVCEPALVVDTYHAATMESALHDRDNDDLDGAIALCGQRCRLRGFRALPSLQVMPLWPAPTGRDDKGVEFRRCEECMRRTTSAASLLDDTPAPLAPEPNWLWDADGPTLLLTALEII